MQPMIDIRNLSKTYEGGFQALKNVDLTINQGEIFALLGPNGAGKTTLISTICGLANPTTGTVTVGGHDIIQDYRQARYQIGLVPQEITKDAFETVWNTVCFSRELFGKPHSESAINKILADLSLSDKKHNKLMTLSGGMKRRVMIAKALSHEPKVLFLDEPTAGVDVELRKSMWEQVRELRNSGVTIILTTHYIQEAEEMADRIGVINKGEIILVEEKKTLMKKLGSKQLVLELSDPLEELPNEFANFDLRLSTEGHQLIYDYDASKSETGIGDLMSELAKHNVKYSDLYTKQSSLEDIFVGLVKQ